MNPASLRSQPVFRDTLQRIRHTTDRLVEAVWTALDWLLDRRH